MTHPFEIAQDLEVGATPEQVWDAIATGEGQDSWFMGRNTVEPREGGTTTFSIGGFTAESTVATWDPPHRFVTTGSPAPDGSFHQFDYTVDAREGGGSSIRFVHSGLLAGDWEAEYEAMSEGDPMYLHKLVQYVTYFRGRYATSVEAFGPPEPDRARTMAAFRRGLGLRDEVGVGDEVRLTPEGLQPIDGVVDFVSPHFLGARSDDALYRFIHGFDGSVLVGHHLFAEGVDQEQAQRMWTAWLAGIAGGSEDGATSA